MTKGLKADELTRGAERLLSYAAQAMQMGARLREFLEDWERFDAYKMLGIPKGASRGEVRRAFFKKALLMHPDKGGDKAAFQQLQAAYDEILAELDGKGEAGQEQDPSEPPSPSEKTEAPLGRSAKNSCHGSRGWPQMPPGEQASARP